MFPLRTILHPTDFSRCAGQALDHALFLARQNGAALHLLHVVEIPAFGLPHLHGDYYAEARTRAMDEMWRMLQALPAEGVRVEPVVEPGPPAMPPAPVILDYAREHEADLIVLGTHGRRGLARLFLGSVAEEVVHEAGCPVFTVREQATPFPAHPLHQVLVPLDLSEASVAALACAREMAVRYQAHLLLLHVVELPHLPDALGAEAYVASDMPQRLAAFAHEKLDALTAGPEWEGVPLTRHVVQGHAAAEIVAFARKQGADLIVLASHGWSKATAFLLGGVTAKVMRAAACPVFIVRMPGPAHAAGGPGPGEVRHYWDV
jgi:nucleotide-binding universal stress UspA family protein